jgi:capsular polysaccharide biosynthesis protein
VKSYVQLIDSGAMATAVVEELGDTSTEFDPDFDVESVDIPETVIIDVQVTADSAKSAQRLAQAYADVVPAQVSEVESIGTAKAAQVALSVIESPKPGERESPGVPYGIVFGALLGLVLGAGGTILWGAIRRERAADESAKA